VEQELKGSETLHVRLFLAKESVLTSPHS